MNKENFLKKLEPKLKYLTPEAKSIELAKLENLNDYNLDPIETANKIYHDRGLNIKVTNKIKFLEALKITIDTYKEKNKIGSLILFFLYLFTIIILIKIPFIYVRDIFSSMFNNLFTTEIIYTIWNLLFEVLYAISAILLFIRLIKEKALSFEKN